MFEAQLLPTLLFELQTGGKAIDGGDGMDWGFVALYTCSRNCVENLNIDGVYGYEEVFVEDLRPTEQVEKDEVARRNNAEPSREEEVEGAAAEEDEEPAEEEV